MGGRGGVHDGARFVEVLSRVGRYGDVPAGASVVAGEEVKSGTAGDDSGALVVKEWR